MSETVILVTGGRCFARTTEEKIIQRWKRCIEKSSIPLHVIEDSIDSSGNPVFSIQLPIGLGRRSISLLIPSSSSDEDLQQAMDEMKNAADLFPC